MAFRARHEYWPASDFLSEVNIKLFPYLFKDTPFLLQLTVGAEHAEIMHDKTAFVVSLNDTDVDAIDVVTSSRKIQKTKTNYFLAGF